MKIVAAEVTRRDPLAEDPPPHVGGYGGQIEKRPKNDLFFGRRAIKDPDCLMQIVWQRG